MAMSVGESVKSAVRQLQSPEEKRAAPYRPHLERVIKSAKCITLLTTSDANKAPKNNALKTKNLPNCEVFLIYFL